MIEIITEADYKDRLAATQNGVLLFFKKLCPHCKNMEKVLEKFGAAKPGIALYGIDIEENAAAAALLADAEHKKYAPQSKKQRYDFDF